MTYQFPMIQLVSWSPLDTITIEKLSTMVNNDQIIQSSMVRGRYGSVKNVTKDTEVRIASGLAAIPSGQAATGTKDVSFSNFFSSGCNPVVTTGVYSRKQREISITLDGAGSSLMPTHIGFRIYAYVNSTSKRRITNSFYVSWIAVGF